MNPTAEDLCLDVFFPGNLLQVTGLRGVTYLVITSIAPVVECELRYLLLQPPVARQVSMKLRIQATTVHELLAVNSEFTAIGLDDRSRFEVNGKPWLLTSIHTDGGNGLELDMIRMVKL